MEPQTSYILTTLNKPFITNIKNLTETPQRATAYRKVNFWGFQWCEPPCTQSDTARIRKNNSADQIRTLVPHSPEHMCGTHRKGGHGRLRPC